MGNGNPDWNILFVDDDEDDYLLTRDLFIHIEKLKTHLEWAQDYQEALQKLPSVQWDAVLVDYDLGTENGIHLIREAVSQGATAPFIMVTGRGRYEVDVEAMRAGAFDYLMKSELSAPLLERVIRYAIERQRVEELLEQRVLERTEELQFALEEFQLIEEELREKLDESLRSQEDRVADYEWYKDLFEFAPSAYLVTDRSGRILQSNLAAATLFNRDRKYLVGKPLIIFISEADRRDFLSGLNRLSQKPANQERELRLQPLEKETIEVHVVVSPIVGMDGKVITIRWLIYPKNPAGQ